MMTQKWRERMAGLREVIALIWTDATGFVRLRLVVALLLIMGASAMTALGPVALKLVVDGFTGQGSGAGISAVALIALYVLSQWLARTVGEIRGLVYARAELRMSRMLSERLFAHVMRLPLRFHLERQTGAISQALSNGLNGYQMVLHTLVFTILPVATELGTIVVVLSRLDHPAFLGLFSRGDSRVRRGVLVRRLYDCRRCPCGVGFSSQRRGCHDRQHSELRDRQVLHR